MAYAFIGTVVHVDEQGFPVCPERFRIHSITVILARDETTGRAHHPHRLIVAAVSVLQFINPGAGRFAQKLVAHTDAHAGAHRRRSKEPADVRHRSLARVRVAGTVGKKRPSNSNVLKS